MSRLKQKAVFLIALPVLSSIAESQASSLGAHVHGEAELAVAIEGDRVEIQLISPAANIFGFEHAPSSTEQKQQIRRSEQILSAADRLFEFEGTICQAVDQTLDIPFVDELSEAVHAPHTEDSHEHEDTHDHENHQNEHVEIVASYMFECDGRAPTGLNVTMLEQFPAIESLDVQWITETKQGAKELTLNQSMIDLR